MAAFVAGPESSYITCANLTVDGGMNALEETVRIELVQTNEEKLCPQQSRGVGHATELTPLRCFIVKN